METFMNISYEMSILLFIAFLGYFIAHRLKLPVAAINITFGIIIGPSVLNIFKYDSLIESLAYLGAIFMIFIAGLAYKKHKIYTKQNIFIALGGMILPWVLGYLVSIYFFSTLESLFIATTLTATSIAVSVNILENLKLMNKKISHIIISAALVDDILGLLMLSISRTYIMSDGNLSYFYVKTLFAIIFFAIALLLGPYVSRMTKKVHNWAKVKNVHHLTYLFSVMIAFLYGALAELVGLSSKIGAFLAGFLLEKLNYQDFKVGTQYMEIIFSSIFFIALGILVEITFSKKFLMLILIIAFVAVLSKLLGSMVSALITKIKFNQALVVGVSMIPRGEVALISAMIGLQIGAISKLAYSVLIFVALITCFITPPLLKLSLGTMIKKKV